MNKNNRLKKIARIAKENPALSRKFIKGLLIAMDEVKEGKIEPYELAQKKRKPGSWAGKVTIKKDFDELPQEFMKI